MSNNNIKDQAKSKLYSFLIGIWSVLLNAFFLCIWLGVQYLVAYIVSLLTTDEMNKILILIFRGIFAISTLIPILINLYKDLYILTIQANNEVKNKQTSS